MTQASENTAEALAGEFYDRYDCGDTINLIQGAIQHQRLATFGRHGNNQMQARHIRRFCKLAEKADQLLEQVTDKFGLSARSDSRILKVARTIADQAAECSK